VKTTKDSTGVSLSCLLLLYKAPSTSQIAGCTDSVWMNMNQFNSHEVSWITAFLSFVKGNIESTMPQTACKVLVERAYEGGIGVHNVK